MLVLTQLTTPGTVYLFGVTLSLVGICVCRPKDDFRAIEERNTLYCRAMFFAILAFTARYAKHSELAMSFRQDYRTGRKPQSCESRYPV